MARRTRHVVARLLAAILMTGITQSIASAEDGEMVPKYTAVELTRRIDADKELKLSVKLVGKPVEVEGVITESFGHTPEHKEWVVSLQGCDLRGGAVAIVGARFLAGSQALDKAKTLEVGDTLTIRGSFQPTASASVFLLEPIIVKIVVAKPLTGRPAARTATAEEFVKEVLSDPKKADANYRGKLIELTGLVYVCEPFSYSSGIKIFGGQPDPDDIFSRLKVKCEVDYKRLRTYWRLATDQKVKVVGLYSSSDKYGVELIRCEVTELEPNPMPTVTATVLSNAYAKDNKLALKMYGNIIEMQKFFMDVTVPNNKTISSEKNFILDGTENFPVKLSLPEYDMKTLKPGAKIFVVVRCHGTERAAGKHVTLSGWIVDRPLPEK